MKKISIIFLVLFFLALLPQTTFAEETLEHSGRNLEVAVIECYPELETLSVSTMEIASTKAKVEIGTKPEEMFEKYGVVDLATLVKTNKPFESVCKIGGNSYKLSLEATSLSSDKECEDFTSLVLSVELNSKKLVDKLSFNTCNENKDKTYRMTFDADLGDFVLLQTNMKSGVKSNYTNMGISPLIDNAFIYEKYYSNKE